jgi:2-oxoisovalerate dehydrogenase E1 component
MFGEQERRILKKALLSRFVDEKLLQLYAEGKLSGTIHTCIGQEMTAAVLTEFLDPADAVVSNHRGHGHYVSFRGNAYGLLAEVLGKADGICGGRGGTQHLCDPPFYANGIQGSIAPIAAGLALARKRRRDGRIAVVFLGDGTLGEGVVYETMNLASKWELPLLFVVEDNGVAQSTRREETLAGQIADRARAFGIETVEADTWRWREWLTTAERLVGAVRAQGRPGFAIVRTYRLKAHSKGDDDRPADEIEDFRQRDPLVILAREAPEAMRPIEHAAQAEVAAAAEAALAAPFPHFPPPDPPAPAADWIVAPVDNARRYGNQALGEGFRAALERSPAVLFFGEDVRSPYGGAFKVSSGLSDRFPDRVWNTPISEAAIVGVGSGLALEGFQPFVEIMFGDFIGLAFDQLVNSAAKFAGMYHRSFPGGLVVRTPMGGGRGYGATHSQCLERSFVGVPGLSVVAINPLLPPEKTIEALADRPTGPTLLIEHKALYASPVRTQWPRGFRLHQTAERLPTAWLRPIGGDVDITLMGYGGAAGMLADLVDELFETHDILAQVLVPTRLYPFDLRPLLPVLESAPRLLVAEEGQGFAAVGAEWIAQLAEISGRPPGVRRVGPRACPVPASPSLEREALPSRENVIGEIVRWVSDG